MTLFATIGATGLYLLFAWLLSAALDGGNLFVSAPANEQFSTRTEHFEGVCRIVLAFRAFPRPHPQTGPCGRSFARFALPPSLRAAPDHPSTLESAVLRHFRNPLGTTAPSYRPRIRISSVEANPIPLPASAIPDSRASSATAEATAPITSRLKTDGMM
jgi:hypothetical protein